MAYAKPTKSPCCPSVRLVPHDGVSLSNPTGYCSMVGALQYLTFTRPDLTFNVHQLCQFMNSPTTTHLEAAKRVLHYFRGTLHHGIPFTLGPLSLTAFADANWAGDPSNCHSTSHTLPLKLNTVPWPPLLLRHLGFESYSRSCASFFLTYLYCGVTISLLLLSLLILSFILALNILK